MRLLFFIVAFDPISLDFFIFCWMFCSPFILHATHRLALDSYVEHTRIRQISFKVLFCFAFSPFRNATCCKCFYLFVSPTKWCYLVFNLVFKYRKKSTNFCFWLIVKKSYRNVMVNEIYVRILLDRKWPLGDLFGQVKIPLGFLSRWECMWTVLKSQMPPPLFLFILFIFFFFTI